MSPAPLTDAPLKGFQRENVEWIRREGRGLLADEPGLGKSRSALEGFAGLDRVLIVAPSLVLQAGVWHDEVELWGDDNTKYYVAPYSMLNDLKDYRTPRQVERGAPKRNKPINRLRKEWRGHWDAVIVDEAHYIKGRDAKRTWAVKNLARNCDGLLLMTGTPIPNWSHEVFTLLQTIYAEEGKRGNELGSFWRWAEQWFDCKSTGFSEHSREVGDLLECTRSCLLRNADDPCVHYRDFAAANFGPKYMRHLRSEHLDLPPIAYEDIRTPMDPSTLAAYRELRKNFAASVDGHDILAWSQGAKNVALDKMTTSPWLLHKNGEPSGGKLETLREDVRRATRPTLVLAHYRDSVEAATWVAESAGARAGYIHGGTTPAQNSALVRDFKRGRVDVLVGSLETLAEGLTLTIADTAIFLERSFKPSRNTQATFRIYRMGQDKAVTIKRYLTPNSVDTGKERLLATKTDRQMRTLTAADYLRVA